MRRPNNASQISSLLLLFVSVVASVYGQTNLPTISAAAVPLYPPLARAARLTGTVTLRVATDGEKVADVTVQEGQPLLARAAQENVRTWKFAHHEPTEFLATFVFDLFMDCNASNENGDVVLNLPSQAIIRVRVRVPECDPSYGLDLSEPLRVFLTSCEVDGAALACERFSIELNSGSLKSEPNILNERGRVLFVIPKEFRSVKAFGVVVRTTKGSFAVSDLDGSFLKGKWRVVIDHKPFQKENRYMTKGMSCIGFIHFQWSEPERIASSPCK